ncbi:MAG: hypothetical protein GY811_06735 [Myxococcales bacterium]|nr:hypothetical protein [Myxococcales bacterium]
MLISLFVSATARPDMWGNGPTVGEIENRFFLAAIAFFVGSLLLAFAGRGLAAGSALAARVYIVGGGLAGVAFTLIVGKGADMTTLVSASAVALSWPSLIAVAVWRRPKSTDPLFAHRFPLPADNGLSGLRTLMIPAAAIELVAAAGALWFGVSAPHELFPTVPALVLAGLLATRAVLQVFAAAGIQENDTKASRLYAMFGLASAGAFVLVNIVVEWDKQFFIFLLGGAAILSSWPYVVRGFLSRHARADAGATVQSRDLGLTAVGWLLLFLGVHEATSYGLGLAIALTHGLDLTLEGLLPVILAFAQVWAGLEILGLTKRMRLSVGLYAICGIATGALMWRDIAGTSAGGIDIANSIGLGAIAAAASLALPIASLIVIFRSKMVEGARP